MTFEAPPSQDPWTPSQDPSTPRQDPSMPRGGFLGFLTTLPGILTATAGLVTAVATALGIYFVPHDGGPSGAGTSGGDGASNATPTSAPVPAGSGQVDPGRLATGLQDASVDNQVSALMTNCQRGDTASCTPLLNQLAQECSQGNGLSCDVLYEVSAGGSSYETYGATCGGRFDRQYADACRRL